jgi:histone H3/H4
MERPTSIQARKRISEFFKRNRGETEGKKEKAPLSSRRSKRKTDVNSGSIEEILRSMDHGEAISLIKSIFGDIDTIDTTPHIESNEEEYVSRPFPIQEEITIEEPIPKKRQKRKNRILHKDDEIEYGDTTDFSLTKKSFGRATKEQSYIALSEMTGESESTLKQTNQVQFTKSALETLQEATEQWIISVIQKSNIDVLRNGKSRLNVKDIVYMLNLLFPEIIDKTRTYEDGKKVY